MKPMPVQTPQPDQAITPQKMIQLQGCKDQKSKPVPTGILYGHMIGF